MNLLAFLLVTSGKTTLGIARLIKLCREWPCVWEGERFPKSCYALNISRLIFKLHVRWLSIKIQHTHTHKYYVYVHLLLLHTTCYLIATTTKKAFRNNHLSLCVRDGHYAIPNSSIRSSIHRAFTFSFNIWMFDYTLTQISMHPKNKVNNVGDRVRDDKNAQQIACHDSHFYAFCVCVCVCAVHGTAVWESYGVFNIVQNRFIIRWTTICVVGFSKSERSMAFDMLQWPSTGKSDVPIKNTYIYTWDIYILLCILLDWHDLHRW